MARSVRIEYGGAFYHVMARGNRRQTIFLDDDDRFFGDRYRAVIVEGELPAYYETLTNYIHLNHGRAGLVNAEKAESILDYPWSSVAGGYAVPPRKRAKWLAVATGMRVLGFGDTAAVRRELVSYLGRRILEEGKRSGEATLAGAGTTAGSGASGRIHRTPGVCGGEACVGMTRVAVSMLEAARRQGDGDLELLKNYPELSVFDLEAAR